MASIVVTASLILGGGTRSGFLADVLLQLSSVPLFLLVVWRYLWPERAAAAFVGAPTVRAPTGIGPATTRPWLPILISAAVVAVPILQLVPLPPEAWLLLPGHRHIASALEIAGRSSGTWFPLSLTPEATVLGMLSLLPPMALFLAIGWLSFQERRVLSLVALSVGVAGVLLGLMQVAQGEESPLRPFEFTNTLDAVGFFANRNHFAAMIYCLLLLAAAWTVEASARAGRGEGLQRFSTSNIAVLLAAFTVLLILIAAQTMTRSRAGVIITILALVPAFAIALADRRSIVGLTPIQVMFGAGALALLFSIQFALYRLLQRFEADPLADARVPFARNTIEAALEFMPFGSGVGSFVPVYGLFERSEDTLTTFANRAHNDLLELWLETGIVGMIVAGGLSVLLVVGTLRAWWRPLAAAHPIDRALARAASGIIFLLIVHSVVDYPLRTGAMMAILALAGGLMIAPPLRGANPSESAGGFEEDGAQSGREPASGGQPRRRPAPVQRAPSSVRTVTPLPPAPGRPSEPGTIADRDSSRSSMEAIQWPSSVAASEIDEGRQPSAERGKAEAQDIAGAWQARNRSTVARSAQTIEEPEWPEAWRHDAQRLRGVRGGSRHEPPSGKEVDAKRTASSDRETLTEGQPDRARGDRSEEP